MQPLTDTTVAVTAMARRCLPVEANGAQSPLASVWMSHAVADPLLFLATLNYAAAHLDFVDGRQSNPRTIAGKVETIRLINLRLQDSTEIVSNTTIGAVAMLVATEVRNPDYDIFSQVSFHNFPLISGFGQCPND